MGHFRQFNPPPALASRVAAFWCHVAGPDADPASPLRVLPDGCVVLIARFRVDAAARGTEPPELTICGPTDRPRLVPLPAGMAWVGVRFRAGMAGPLLGVPAPDLFRRQIGATDASPRFAPLLDRLGDAPTPARALAALEGFVRGAAAAETRAGRPSDRARRAIELLERSRGAARVAAVARAVGASERTLRRDVERAAGLTPKALARIYRFQAAWAALGSDPTPDLAKLALACGYADQAHLARDFRALAGLPPRALAASVLPTRLDTSDGRIGRRTLAGRSPRGPS